MFGAYFGLAVAYILGKPAQTTETEANHVSDVFSLIGTLFLFIYWPSFNGGELDANSHAQQRAVVGTIFSLCAATVGTFFASSFLNNSAKFRPVDIQNATLAGGVAIGAVCNLTLSLSDCLLIGFIAGVVSTAGFARIQAWLENSGVHDTCGIHNLHGMPSIIGGLASVALCYYKAPLGHDMPSVFRHDNQASLQLMSVCVTLLFAITTGLLTGMAMRTAAPLSTTDLYSDLPYWEVEAHEDTPEQHDGHSHEHEHHRSHGEVELGNKDCKLKVYH
jgi:ammonium transporter Rh